MNTEKEATQAEIDLMNFGAAMDRVRDLHVVPTEISYEEKRGQAEREADRLAASQFAREAGSFLHSLGVKFKYRLKTY